MSDNSTKISEEFRESVEEAIERSEWKAFERWESGECTYTGREVDPIFTAFDRQTFDEILHLLGNARFLSLDGSFKILKIVEDEWGRLSDDQRNAFLPLITEAYTKFTDPMSWFIIAELLGEYYASERSLEALRQIRDSAVGEQRELLPMGFQCLVQYATEPEVRDAAETELERLSLDESKRVRDEVEISRARLRNRLNDEGSFQP